MHVAHTLGPSPDEESAGGSPLDESPGVVESPLVLPSSSGPTPSSADGVPSSPGLFVPFVPPSIIPVLDAPVESSSPSPGLKHPIATATPSKQSPLMPAMLAACAPDSVAPPSMTPGEASTAEA